MNNIYKINYKVFQDHEWADLASLNIFNKISKFEKTFISVAHRIGTLKKSDLIIKIEEGKIVNQGRYNQFEEK